MVDTALAYVDSSVLVRAYLADEPGHAQARALLEGVEGAEDVAGATRANDADSRTGAAGSKILVTATFALVEVTSTLVRARHAKRISDVDVLIEKLYEEVSPDGPVHLIRPDPAATESAALTVVRHYALHTLEAMHLAVADLAARPLAEPGEQIGFVTHSATQRNAARALGFVPLPEWS